MLERAYKSPLIAFSVLVSFLCTEPATRAQEGVYEIRCRGGKALFAIDKLDAKTLSLNFMPSPRAAGTESGGLNAGTCSWIDRTLKENEPQQIQFEVSRGQADSIPKYLDDPDNYWSFFVSNTNRGYYETRSHRAWKARTQDTAPSGEESKPPIPAGQKGAQPDTTQGQGKEVEPAALPCATKKCPPGTRCVHQQIVCVKAPCPGSVTQCVAEAP